MGSVAVFAPSPLLTVTVEEAPTGPDLHVHAGGQGVWQARMLQSLGASVTLCSVLLGEVGDVVRHLVEREGIHLRAVERDGRGAAYVHDRRGGEREPVIETPGDVLTRHDLDELYNLAFHSGLEADLTVLSGPAGDVVLPADTYRRLAADLRSAGRPVVADLAGERLDAVVAGGLAVLKVSDEELVDDGRASGTDVRSVVEAMRRLREEGAACVIVTRSAESTLVLDGGRMLEVRVPALEVVDTKGAGDSLTAGVAAALADRASIEDAVRLGAAAGALNVTRHGLGSARPDAVKAMTKQVEIRPFDGEDADQ
ncbi:1-phosphofructokinase family hexose kinase [Naasia sp. SYSU D00057]|uniref:1-phosphofructokinase family hexose kinase n=1 Tax=Naasia sp. SYSU D00057 TaxID=2817380 RepID=UPI001B30EF12|nr:PfkB family carbohydrate kinase [Naasia sp. SYSU D00057]